MHRVYVLRAMGADEDLTYSSIRFAIERLTINKEAVTLLMNA